MRPFAAVLLLALPAAAAQPTLPAAPGTGVDADISRSLADAATALAQGRPDADEQVLSLYRSEDRFSAAQRGQLAPQAVAMLRQAGRQHLMDGRLELAARDLDAAWTLSGAGQDPEYARTLVRWAKAARGESPAEALFLARRARLADVGLSEAMELDRALSTNPNVGLAVLAEGVAVAGLVSGLVFGAMSRGASEGIRQGTHPRAELDALIAQARGMRLASLGSYAGAALAAVIGVVLFWTGERTYVPTSPSALPALNVQEHAP